MSIETVPIGKIKILEELYPRDEISNETVNQYRVSLPELPAITLAPKNGYYVLVDGAHRLRAHEIEGETEINAEILEEMDDQQILLEAIKRNATHGRQLTLSEKRRHAVTLYKSDVSQDSIVEILAISDRSFRRWTEKLRVKAKEERNIKVYELWLRCETQESLAEKFHMTQPGIKKIIDNITNGQLTKSYNPESLQLSDVWRFSECDSRYGSRGYPGQIPGQILENFLHYFTKPFDTVIDPMAGGGTTGDVCKSMHRRYRLYDLHPLSSRPEIKQHDVRDGYPCECKGCDAIFLDPPYWHMMDKDYKKGSVSELDKNGFLQFLNKLAVDSYSTLNENGVLGFICEDIVPPVKGIYRGPEPLFLDEMVAEFRRAGFDVIWRVNVPLTMNQYDALKVSRAKEKNVMLHLTRDLYIFRKRPQI